MVFADITFDLFLSIQARVRTSLIKSTAETPFEYEKERFFKAYNVCYRIWAKRDSQRHVSETFSVGRNTIKKWEQYFVKHGVIGLLSIPEHIDVDPRLEQLVVLVNSARPHENSSFILKLADILEIPGATLDIVRRIQRSYGYGQRQDNEDRKYYGGLQKILSSIVYYRTTKKDYGHNPKARFETFYAYHQDPFQHKVELFKTLSLCTKKRQIRPLLQQFGIHSSRYYQLKDRYLIYGVWGLIDLIHSSRRIGEKISPELEIQIIEERLMNPTLSANRMMEKLKLKCSQVNVSRIYQRWQLSRFSTAVPVRGTVATTIPDEIQSTGTIEQSAMSRFPNLIQDSNLKVNINFTRLLQHLRYKSIPICNPGAILMAPFLSQLGIVEALHTHGPELKRTTEITNDILVNVLRIVAGYPTINDFSHCSDLSVAIGAGLTATPCRSRHYESFDELRFKQLQKLRNDLACRARELGIIEGEQIAVDYHCDPTDSKFPKDKSISKSPDQKGNLVYAHRPQILWDSGTNSIINIAYCEGASRAPTALYNFFEKNLYKIIDPSAVKEIYADSEYTGHKQLIYLIVRSQTEVTMCLKQNPKILKWKEETIKNGKWHPYEKKYRIASKDFILPETGKLFRFVVKQNLKTNETRCFGSTRSQLSPQTILDNYHLRWCVESGIKDLGENYYLNKPPGTSLEKIELHYYCVMIARLLIDYFLSIFCDSRWKKPEGWDCVISTLRTSIFCSQSCQLTLHPCGDLLITYLVGDKEGVKTKLQKTLSERAEVGLNKVPWWGERGVRIEISDEYKFIPETVP